MRWITTDFPPLDSSAAQAVGVQIYKHTSCSEAGDDIRDLLEELEFHPLSINFLANAAQQDDWYPATLLKRWHIRHSAGLGEDGRCTIAIITFLLQGLTDNLGGDLLPSLQEVDNICDVIGRQSLIYLHDNFIKVLAPIRHYVQDSLPIPDSTRLREIRIFYYSTVQQCSKEQDGHANIIISDHFNIERVLPFYRAHILDETYRACSNFLKCLEWQLPRQTTLSPALLNVV
ncbi:hypothetical protein BDR06DRAFT_1015308 [Suillus hirtellus]|nr:hypothetical protein BDR06DRAFT_1015308 [Suillus hirtellus]